MPYAKTTWADGVTPVNAANLQKIEDALAGTPYAGDFGAADRVPVWDGTKFVPAQIADAQIAAAAAIAASKLAGYPADGTKALYGDGSWKVPAGGGGGAGTDWKGAWSAGFTYAESDVVTYQNVVYLAVNPSTGQTPPLVAAGVPQSVTPIPFVTALPSSPFDGQEVYFTDSLTAPTYQWHLRYVAAKATNKWIFLGGADLVSLVDTVENTSSATPVDLTTVGPSVTVPLAGQYRFHGGARLSTGSGDGKLYYKIGAAAAVLFTQATPGGVHTYPNEVQTLACAAGDVVKLQYAGGTTATWGDRWMRLEPIAVGG